mgnify:CR=1 FL=1
MRCTKREVLTSYSQHYIIMKALNLRHQWLRWASTERWGYSAILCSIDTWSDVVLF